MEQFFAKLPSAHKHFIYLWTDWKEDEIEFLLQETEHHKCYRGTYNKCNLQETAQDFDIALEDMEKEIKSACHVNNSEFKFVINDSKLQIFKIISDCPCLFVEVDLSEELPFVVYDKCLEKMSVKKEEKGQKTNSKNNDEAAAAKSNDDAELWQKFALVLNAKKSKIAYLEEQLKKERAKHNNDAAMQENDNGSNDEDEYQQQTQPMTPPHGGSKRLRISSPTP